MATSEHIFQLKAVLDSSQVQNQLDRLNGTSSTASTTSTASTANNLGNNLNKLKTNISPLAVAVAGATKGMNHLGSGFNRLQSVIDIITKSFTRFGLSARKVLINE